MDGISTLIQSALYWIKLLIMQEPVTAFVVLLIVSVWYLLSMLMIRKMTGMTLHSIILRFIDSPAMVMFIGAFELFIIVFISIFFAASIGLPIPKG